MNSGMIAKMEKAHRYHEERDRFQAGFTANAASSPVTQIVGTPPELIEPCEIIAVAEGWEGFEATPRF